VHISRTPTGRRVQAIIEVQGTKGSGQYRIKKL